MLCVQRNNLEKKRKKIISDLELQSYGFWALTFANHVKTTFDVFSGTIGGKTFEFKINFWHDFEQKTSELEEKTEARLSKLQSTCPDEHYWGKTQKKHGFKALFPLRRKILSRLSELLSTFPHYYLCWKTHINKAWNFVRVSTKNFGSWAKYSGMVVKTAL